MIVESMKMHFYLLRGIGAPASQAVFKGHAQKMKIDLRYLKKIVAMVGFIKRVIYVGLACKWCNKAENQVQFASA